MAANARMQETASAMANSAAASQRLVMSQSVRKAAKKAGEIGLHSLVALLKPAKFRKSCKTRFPKLIAVVSKVNPDKQTYEIVTKYGVLKPDPHFSVLTAQSQHGVVKEFNQIMNMVNSSAPLPITTMSSICREEARAINGGAVTCNCYSRVKSGKKRLRDNVCQQDGCECYDAGIDCINACHSGWQCANKNGWTAVGMRADHESAAAAADDMDEDDSDV